MALPPLLALLALPSLPASQGDAPRGLPPPVPVEGAEAATAEEMRPYVERVAGVEAVLEMVPLPGGRFRMGSQPDELGRREDEGPAHEVELSPFWMAATETTWDFYHVFMLKLDLDALRAGRAEESEQDAWADAVSRPTPPYVPMDFGMGVEGYPAVGMTQLAAKQFAKWLSMKTGRFYRLPTEAEWEYACRAGAETAYSFGGDAGELERFAWYAESSGGSYHPVGTVEPNAFGLFDLHGNVAEWVVDRHDREVYGERAGSVARDPVAWPEKEYPRVVRGGSFEDGAEDCRCAARRRSTRAWKLQDPQLPKSIWYHTDAPFVGFRVVRPLDPPPPEEWERWWEPDVDSLRRVLERQRAGGR